MLANADAKPTNKLLYSVTKVLGVYTIWLDRELILVKILFILFISVSISGCNKVLNYASLHKMKNLSIISIKLGANPNNKEFTGTPPLLAAAIIGDFEMVKTLEAHGASVHEKDDYNSNVLNIVCYDFTMTEYFIKKGVNVNNQSWNSKKEPTLTPLMCAVVGNKIEVVKLLLTSGADKGIELISATTGKTITALTLSEKKGFKNISAILK